MMEEPRGELLVIPPRTLDLPTPRPQFIYSQQAALGPGRDYHPLVSYQDIKARLSEFLPKNLDRKAQVETSKLAESLIKHVVTEDELKCLNDYEKRVLLSLIGFQTIGVNNIQLTEKMLTLTGVNKPQPQAKERATVLFERLNYRPPQLSQLVSNHPALPYLLKPELVPQEVFTLMQEEFEKRFLMQCFAAIPSNSHGLSNTELQTITKRDLDAVASQTFAQLLKEYFLTRGAVIPVKTLKEVDDIQGQWKNVSPLPKVLVPEPTRKIDLEEKGEIIARQKKLSEIKKSLPQFNEVLWQELTHDKQIPAFFTRWEGTPKLARKTLREKTIDLFYDGVKPRDRFSAWVMGMWDQLDHYDPAKFFRIGFLSHARRDFGILESDLPDLVLSHKRTVSMKEKILSAKKNLRPVEDTLSYLVIKQLLEKLDNKTLNPYVSEKLHQYQKAHYGKRVATQQLLNDIESNPRQFVVDFFLADPDFKAYEVGNRMAQLTKQASEKARLSQLKTPQDLEFTHRQELKRVAWRTFVEGKYPSQRPEVVSLAYQSLLQVSRMARFTDQEAAFERITKLTDKLSKYSYNLNRLFQKVFSVKEGERLFTPPLKREPHYPFHEPKIEPKKPRFYKYVDIKDLPRALQMPGVKAVEYRDGDVRVILDHEKLGTVGKLLATKEILEKQFTAKIAHRMGPIHEKLRPYTKVVESIGLNIIAAVAASRFTEFYAHLTETPYDRIQQFSSAAIGYYFRQIGWKKVEIPKLGWNVPIYPQLNLRNTSKMFLRGGALSLGVAGPVLMMKQLGLIPQNADIVTTLATPILGKAIGGNIFTSLGLNIGSEQIVNAIFNEKGRSDEFGDWLMFREYDKRQADQLYQADTNKRHRARWKQLADLVDDQTLTPRTLLSAASQSQTIQDYLMMTIALNPSRYNFRVRYDLSGKQHIIDNLGNLHLLEQADRQIYHLAQLLPDNEPLKTKILAACLGKTTETPDDLTHTSNRLGNFGNKTIEWLKKKYGLIPNDKENDNTNDLSDFVAHLQRRVVGTQALSTTGSLGTSMLFLGLHQHDIEKTGGNLWETLVGPTYHGAPPLTLPLMSVNPQEIQVYNDQLATPQDRFNELALRFSELNYIYSLWQSGNLEQTPGKAEILSYYQVTDTQLDKLRDILVQNRLTSNDLATVSELYSQEHFQKDDLFELLAVSLNGKHTALGPLIDALPSAPHALNQALGQSIEAHHATSLVFGLSDQEGSQILSRLGIPPESLNVQIDFLPLTDEQKKELLTVDSPLTIVGKSVIIRDKEYPLAAIFYDDASPQAMATFSLLARVISSSDSVWQKAFSDSQFPYPVFLAQASKVYADQGFPQTPDNQFVFPDTSFFKTIRDAVIEGSHGQLSSSQINDLLSKAIHGDPSSYNTLTTTIRESDQNIAVLNTFNSAVPEPHENLMYDMVSQAHTKEDIVRQVRLFYDQFGLEPAVQRFDKLGLNWEKISHNDYTPPHFDLAKILNGQSDLSQELVNLNNKRGVVFIQDGKVAGSFHQIFNIPVSDYPADLKEIDDMT